MLIYNIYIWYSRKNKTNICVDRYIYIYIVCVPCELAGAQYVSCHQCDILYSSAYDSHSGPIQECVTHRQPNTQNILPHNTHNTEYITHRIHKTQNT